MTKPSYILLLFTLPFVHLQTLSQSNNLTVCNTESIATKTIFEFWHEATDDCELDTNNLFEIRKKLLENHNNNDKITELLSNHISSSFMELLFNQIMATISTKSSIRNKSDLQKIINNLYAEDKTFILKIWQQAVDESTLFMDKQSVIQHILLIEDNNELKLDLLDYLLNKYEGQQASDQQFMGLLVYGITSIEKEIAIGNNTNTEINVNLSKILQKLPQPLLFLYQHWAHNITLLNRHYNDYIYAERNIGPADNKRYIFTFMPNQNKYKSKGYFKVQLNAKGMLAIGAFYGPSYKYIAAEDHSAFICMDSPAEGSQWWQVLWPLENDDFVAFQNTATEELLCATDQYNEKLILISMLATDKHKNNPACHWKVFKRVKNHHRM